MTVPLCGSCHGLVHSVDLTSVSRLTKLAMDEKRAKGEYIGGKVRYGYKLAPDGVRLVECEAEQENIRALVQCRRVGMSYRAASMHLAERGVVNRHGNPFGPQSMVNMLKTYEGVSNATD